MNGTSFRRKKSTPCCRASPARARSSSRNLARAAASAATSSPARAHRARAHAHARDRQQRFARNLRVGLFNFLRKSPEISIGGIKVQKYSAFLREIVVPTNFNIVSIRPLRGSGLIVCDRRWCSP